MGLRGIKAQRIGLGLVLGGLVLLAIHPVSRFYPICPIYQHFHVLCPGCGATRALASLLHGDLVGAWRLNALFVAALPFLAGYGVAAYRRAGWPQVSFAAVGFTGAVAVVFGVARNL